jgi:hypothetical protein
MDDAIELLADGRQRETILASENTYLRDVIKDQRKRIAELLEALLPFAVVAEIAVSKHHDPKDERLWSYYNAREERQHAITRAHLQQAHTMFVRRYV